MNKPSISDVLTKVDTLHEAIASLADTVATRFDKVERTLDEHSVALLELATVTAEHSALHREHRAALGRIERRQRSETRALDDHENRLKVLEQRPYPPASAR